MTEKELEVQLSLGTLNVRKLLREDILVILRFDLIEKLAWAYTREFPKGMYNFPVWDVLGNHLLPYVKVIWGEEAERRIKKILFTVIKN